MNGEVNAEEPASILRWHATEARNLQEENIRQRAEHALRTKAFDKIGIPWAVYEYTGKYAVVKGRADAQYGRVIIECESPRTLDKKPGVKHAFDQAVDYIKQEAAPEKFWPRFHGIILDGFKIGFTRHCMEKWQPQGPFEVNAQTVLKLPQKAPWLAKTWENAKMEALRGRAARPKA
jgi:hypothetical protein